MNGIYNKQFAKSFKAEMKKSREVNRFYSARVTRTLIVFFFLDEKRVPHFSANVECHINLLISMIGVTLFDNYMINCLDWPTKFMGSTARIAESVGRRK